jgi:hypothetical protein
LALQGEALWLDYKDGKQVEVLVPFCLWFFLLGWVQIFKLVFSLKNKHRVCFGAWGE